MVPADLAVERADQQAVGAQQTDQQILHRTLAVECSERRRGRCNRSRRVEIRGELGVRRSGCGWESPHHEHRRAGQRGNSRPCEMPQAPLHPVAGDRVADRLADHKPRLGTGVLDRRDRVSGVDEQMQNHCARARPTTPAGRAREQARRGQSVVAVKHRERSSPVRPRACCDPCDGARTGWRGRRGYASAVESHGSCAGGGCSAGTCACSRVRLRCVRWCARVWGSTGVSAGTAHPRKHSGSPRGAGPRSEPRPDRRESRGHAAPVDTGSTAPRYAVPPMPVKPAGPGHRCGQPLDREARGLLAFCRPRDSPRSTLPA